MVAGQFFNTTHILSTSLHRQVRALSYPEESEMGLFFALAIPLDDPESTKSISVAFFFEANYGLPTSSVEMKEIEGKRSIKKRPITRKIVYSMLESKLESLGFPGRQCLLRTICETTRSSSLESNGLVGNVIAILFRPSYSAEELEEDLQEYYQAEKNSIQNCDKTYASCPISIYDYIVELDS